MKNLYLTRGNNIIVDPENPNVFDSLKSKLLRIDRLYVVEEPIHIVYRYPFDGNVVEKDAEPGDIIITFYTNEDATPNKFVVVKSKEWTENIKAIEEYEQAQKERWAADKKENEKDN